MFLLGLVFGGGGGGVAGHVSERVHEGARASVSLSEVGEQLLKFCASQLNDWCTWRFGSDSSFFPSAGLGCVKHG